MKKRFLIVACVIAANFATAAPVRVPADFVQCKSLEECLHALDAEASQRADGSGSALDGEFAARLEQFGEPAKRELLKRAAGEDRGWRNLAGAILMHWAPFEPADVPALIEALHKEPGGWIARPLGRIATPEAVDALTEDVRLHGAASQSGWALSQLGDRVFPYLLPLLSDDKHWRDAAMIMRDMKSNAADGLDAWLGIALDPAKPERDRIGALRGIGIIGTSAKDLAPRLRPLLAVNDGYGPIPETAQKVLTAMGDETMAPQTVLACEPSTNPFEGSFDSTTCLERAATYGKAIYPYANLLLNMFTNSHNGTDRANGASVLGYIGYAPATARLIELLNDSDWRVVYAAARSLGWLRARNALPALRAVAEAHWLADVRGEAIKAIAAIDSPAAVLVRPKVRAGTLDYPPEAALEVDATAAPDIAPCGSHRWRWSGHEFGEEDNVHLSLPVSGRNGLPAGILKGRDAGEWGGEVKWESGSASPSLIATGNVEGIELYSGGAIAVIGSGGVWNEYDAAPETFTISNGPGGSGYALGLRRDVSGAWRVKEIARFPRAAFGLKAIGHAVFAVWSGNRAVIFDPSSILGIARCVAMR